jgi:3-dehydrosphinganine reductase
VSSYFRDKTALVVGGTQGIGLEVARQLSELGCRVWVAARDQARLADVCDSLSAAPLALDVTDRGQTDELLRKTMESEGVFDLVVNCAGLAFPGYLVEQSADDVRRMMEVNYFGTYNVCKAVTPLMQARGSGTIVNTSSLGGLMGLFGYTGYCASKYAVVGFSEALRREVKPFGLKVCLLCPPNTDTPGLARENLTKPPEVLAQEENVKTVSPEFVAEKLLRALPRGKSLVIPTFDGWLAYYLSRYAPFILNQFVKRPNPGK